MNPKPLAVKVLIVPVVVAISSPMLSFDTRRYSTSPSFHQGCCRDVLNQRAIQSRVPPVDLCDATRAEARAGTSGTHLGAGIIRLNAECVEPYRAMDRATAASVSRVGTVTGYPTNPHRDVHAPIASAPRQLGRRLGTRRSSADL